MEEGRKQMIRDPNINRLDEKYHVVGAEGFEDAWLIIMRSNGNGWVRQNNNGELRTPASTGDSSPDMHLYR
ncbi:hypothetical protein PIB30_035725 [Stylosanthes scabra]|uniref:Uncharacterized protein n=1 Tax=Stylosanthes scabra TaxID=79078 RepID=A0ABU6YBT1_9FABA|nr:hypothetical protein [Stylosanthes scabra]